MHQLSLRWSRCCRRLVVVALRLRKPSAKEFFSREPSAQLQLAAHVRELRKQDGRISTHAVRRSLMSSSLPDTCCTSLTSSKLADSPFNTKFRVAETVAQRCGCYRDTLVCVLASPADGWTVRNIEQPVLTCLIF